MEAEINTLIGDKQESRARKILGRNIYVLETFGDIEYTVEPKKGTRLWDVDQSLEGFPATIAVSSYLSQSYDHLDALAKLLGEAHAQHMGAPFTLIRASFEAIGRGMWLLTPGSRKDIIERRLRLEWENMWNQNSAMKTIDDTENPTRSGAYKERLIQLSENPLGHGSISSRLLANGQRDSPFHELGAIRPARRRGDTR